MTGLFIWLGGAFAFYRAGQDAGTWVIESNMEAISNYAEAFIISKMPKVGE